MAIRKQAFDVGTLAAEAGDKGMSLLRVLGTLGIVGVPSLAAYAGYIQRNAENKIVSDRDFRERSEKAKIQRDTIKALEQQVVY